MISKARTSAFSAAALWAAMLAGCGEETSPAEPLEQARAALAAGDGYGAELTLKAMLDNGVPRDDIAAYLGAAERQQGEFRDARKWLEPGNFSTDSAALGFHELALLEIQEGQLPAAGAAFDKALEHAPRDPQLWVDIGRLRYRGGEHLQALKAAQYAVELGPQFPDALHFHAQILRDSVGTRAATPWFARALSLAPHDPVLRADLALTQGDAGRPVALLETIGETAKGGKIAAGARFGQAVVAARGGDYALARLLLEKSAFAKNDIPAGLMLSAVIDLRNNNASAAAQTLQRLAGIQPENRAVRLLLARALFNAGSYQELLSTFGETSRSPDAAPYLLTLLGRAHEALDQRDKAADYLDRATKARSGNLYALRSATPLGVSEARGNDTLDLVRGRITARRPGAAVAAAEAFLRRHSGSVDALILAGDARLAAGNVKKAIAHYETAASVRRPWILTRKLAAAYRADGQNAAARDLLRAHLISDGVNLEALARLAEFHTRDAEGKMALLALNTAIENGGWADPELLTQHSRVALMLNDPDTALVSAAQALAIAPGYRKALSAYIDASLANGVTEEKLSMVRTKLAKLR